MKVALYTICLNESKHVKQFMDCAREADGIFITDTGSSDDTVKLLLEEGAKVQTMFLKTSTSASLSILMKF